MTADHWLDKAGLSKPIYGMRRLTNFDNVLYRVPEMATVTRVYRIDYEGDLEEFKKEILTRLMTIPRFRCRPVQVYNTYFF